MRFFPTLLVALLAAPAAVMAQYPPAPQSPTPPRAQERAAPAASDDARPRRLPDPPAYPRYVPPGPQPRPNPPVGRRMLQRAGAESGLLLSAGLQRELSAGAELQLRLSRNIGIGIGAQGGVAFGSDLVCPTYGGTGRLYTGRDHRFVAELGFGRNRIDPWLNSDPSEAPSCSGGEANLGPELSAGYQSVSRQGFVFEALGGLVFLTNDAMRSRHGLVSPAFQLKVGYLIH